MTVRNSSREVAVAVPLGSAAKVTHFWRCQTLHSPISCGRYGTLWYSNMFHTFASFSQDDFHFSWQAQHFGDLHRHFVWQAQNFRRVVLRAFANRIIRAMSNRDNVQIPWQALHLVGCDKN